MLLFRHSWTQAAHFLWTQESCYFVFISPNVPEAKGDPKGILESSVAHTVPLYCKWDSNFQTTMSAQAHSSLAALEAGAGVRSVHRQGSPE